eukprot:1160331-Pelagomonas_calceolata.AAC.5
MADACPIEEERLVALESAVHMRALEEERLVALESAARARAEVAELTESRRKLEWQSRLLEKMSEVSTLPETMGGFLEKARAGCWRR